MNIPGEQLERTFQIARDSTPRLAISRIVPGSQAERLALRAGDVIVTYNGVAIAASDDIDRAKETVTADRVDMVILRGGAEKVVSLEKGSIGIFTEIDYY